LSAEDDVKNVKVSIYMSEDLRARFKSACALHRKSMNEVLVEFIEDYLEENERPAPKKDKGAA
jgi:hypothetical protein